MILEKDFRLVANYVKSEGIKINFEEFLFQAKNHPDYPAILAITDTLSFFNIDNGVISVETSEIGLLPNRFVVLLKKENSQPQFHFIEKNDHTYFNLIDKKKVEISKSELESRWNNLVLLIEKSETKDILIENKNNYSWIFPSLCLALFLVVLFQYEENFQTKLFFTFPIAGVLFSIAALKDLFGTQSELLNSFCNMTVSTSCANVVGSNKWKIFEIINFSDLSMVFFFSQFLGLLVFLVSSKATAYFAMQQILITAAVPVLFLSVYYQKFVEKKWCPICLVIISIILLEFGYLFIFQNVNFVVSMPSVTLFGLVFASVTIAWSALKKLLTRQKELKEFQLKGIRFMRNYEVFKNTLLATTPIENSSIFSQGILLGNTAASLKIVVVTSPFCGFCAEAHTIIEDILEKHPEEVCFYINFNFNSEQDDEKSKKVYQQLVAIYYSQGQEVFMKTLHNWFEDKDENKLSGITIDGQNELKINEILNEQFRWNQKNDFTYTPAILINQYVFPKQYDRKELIHFINDLSDDEDFQ